MMKKKSFISTSTTAAVVIGLTVLMMMTMTTVYLLGIHPIQPKLLVLDHHSTVFIKHRKLLAHSTVEPNRIWGDKCSTSDIMVIQGPTGPLPSGIPTYTVEIMNVCPNGCNISQIHLSCGWFSSARLVNPKIFKRLRPDDCLVNGGKTLFNGRTLSFQYANTFPYPLAVSSVHC